MFVVFTLCGVISIRLAFGLQHILDFMLKGRGLVLLQYMVLIIYSDVDIRGTLANGRSPDDGFT